MTMNIREFKLEQLRECPLAGRNLIEASAGTGKTFTIAGLYLRLLLEKGLRVNQILVVTFTEAATKELRDRIRQRLRTALDVFVSGMSDDPLLTALIGHSKDMNRDRERLSEALTCFDEAAIFTIHGFCQRVLQEKAFESGSLFDTELVTDQQDLMREVVDDFWRIHFLEASSDWLAWAQKKGAAPDDLFVFACKVGKVADLQVLPESNPSDDTELLERAKLAFSSAASAWLDHRDEIIDILSESPALKRNLYRATSIQEWAESFNGYFSCGSLLPYPEKLEKLTTEALAAGVKKGQVPPEHSFFAEMDQLLSDLDNLQHVWRKRLLALKGKLAENLPRELSLRKRRQNIRAFDDLLLDLRAALRREGGERLARELGMRFPAALIDEFQDTDPVQYAIFDAIYPNASSLLFLIGDPKQAIYSFRGADIFAYLEAASRVEHRYTLGRNWRSDGPLVKAINRLFEVHPQPFLFENISFFPVNAAPEKEHCALIAGEEIDPAPLQLWFMPRKPDEKRISAETAVPVLAEAVASEIVRLLQAGTRQKLTINGEKVSAGDIAVLVRRNAQAVAMQKALTARGVPSVLYSTESLFVSREIEELRRVLAAVTDPPDDGLLRTALATDMLGWSGEALEAIVADEVRWEALVERFSDYHDLWARRGFTVMANALLAREEVSQRLLGYADGERRQTNLLHAIEVLHQATLEHRLGMEGLLTWTAEQIAECPLRDEYQLRLETDEQAVKLVTIHRSKGLEYPIVFCPFTWGHSQTRPKEPVQYHDPQTGEATLHLAPEGCDQAREATERELLGENLRLLYVALTRARHRCYLTWGGFNQSETSAPAYLFHGTNPGMNSFEELAQSVKELNDTDMLKVLERLTIGCDESIRVSAIPHPGEERWQRSAQELVAPRCRPFTGHIASDWKISSFSSLVSGKEVALDLPDRDLNRQAQDKAEEFLPLEKEEGKDIFHFPRGARAGSCLHEIFENLDFRYADDARAREMIFRKLRLYGYGEEWDQPVLEMVERVVAAELVGDFGSLRLEKLAPEARMPELEFHFPAERISSSELRAIFTRNLEGIGRGPLFEEGFRPRLRGFIKGFIDLVFCYEGRYYLLDWKSNYLGDRAADYHPEALRSAMVRDDYLLQYHLYTVALCRLLKARLPSYDHARHFGGVFYLYLRGIERGGPSGTGIYYDRPSERMLAELEAFLHGDSSHVF